MPRYRKGRDLQKPNAQRPPNTKTDPAKLRIIGGHFRGRLITWSGDPITRPMKDDVREAVFNLVGGWVPDKVAFDLFAGSGAMGLEAVSRGASQAWFIERHFPSAKIIRENIELLDPNMNAIVAASDTFFWSRNFLHDVKNQPVDPWIVFFCPPYGLYVKEKIALLQLIESFVAAAPMDSLVVVESDARFNVEQLPGHQDWVVRQYSPAVVSVLKKF